MANPRDPAQRINPRDPNNQNSNTQAPPPEHLGNPNHTLPHHPDVEGVRPATVEELTAPPPKPRPDLPRTG